VKASALVSGLREHLMDASGYVKRMGGVKTFVVLEFCSPSRADSCYALLGKIRAGNEKARLVRSRARAPRGRGPSVAGICQAAAQLGVTRQHLWCVLSGQRESKPLTARYGEWKRKQEGAGE
jgi:hypothetical protein